MNRFRSVLTVFLALLALCPTQVTAQETLPPATDLRADAIQSRRQHLPILLFFRSATCPYCREVEELYLRPLLRDNGQAPRVILRTVEVDQARLLTGFDGKPGNMRALARTHGVALVPHLKFVGPEGERLAPDLVGISSRDFYNAYLEDAIRTAGARLRAAPAR
jgi:hypothetical protein